MEDIVKFFWSLQSNNCHMVTQLPNGYFVLAYIPEIRYNEYSIVIERDGRVLDYNHKTKIRDQLPTNISHAIITNAYEMLDQFTIVSSIRGWLKKNYPDQEELYK